MKRAISVMLSVILLLSLCACGKKETAATWQEKYDLGVRYLSEGNYEEAIIAFTAAIEIDPRHQEAYISLADAYIGLGDYDKARSTLQKGREVCGDLEDFSRLEANLSFLESGEVGIRITELYFDKQTFLSGGETDFLVSVAYQCPEEECILMIGANTYEADSFRMMDEDHRVTGGGGYQFQVSLTPVQWDNAYFGIYVNLSEADHEEKWTPFASDTLFIDPQGNVIGNNSNAEGANTSDLLAQGDNGKLVKSIDEISFFNHTADNIDIETMRAIMIENGFKIATNEEHTDYSNDDFLWIQGSLDGMIGAISAMQYFSDDYVCIWGFDDYGRVERSPLQIGVRDISMRDDLETVLSKLGFSNAGSISAYIYSIARREYGSDENEWPDELIQDGNSWPHLDMEHENYHLSGAFSYSMDSDGNQTSGYYLSSINLQVYVWDGSHNCSLDFNFGSTYSDDYNVGYFSDLLSRFSVNVW